MRKSSNRAVSVKCCFKEQELCCKHGLQTELVLKGSRGMRRANMIGPRSVVETAFTCDPGKAKTSASQDFTKSNPTQHCWQRTVTGKPLHVNLRWQSRCHKRH